MDGMTFINKSPDLTRQMVVAMAWNIPVMILLCTLLGLFIGRKLGHPKAGVVCGWIFGMICVAYEIWKLSRSHALQEARRKKDSAPNS